MHFVSGLTLSIFIGSHLFNHIYSVFGAQKHIEVMLMLRPIYRNMFIETILILAVIIQIWSGIKLIKVKRKLSPTMFNQLQIWSGIYLAFFLIIHLTAIIVGRTLLNLDTNFYFGVAGLNTFPMNLFFIPYYVIALLAVFAHISAIHYTKMKLSILGVSPLNQSRLILILGFCITLIICYGLTNQFRGVEIPDEYNLLIGK